MARILVIEDNAANLELMSYLLRAGGHDIVTAEDGLAGLARAATPPLADIIVCDIHLPRLDGYEIARRLKADLHLRRIPLVAVTALAMVGDKEKVLAAGFDGYIPKPINPREFLRQVLAFQEAGGAGVRILVVDDSPANRAQAHAALAPHGYRVTAVAGIAEASACLERESFDVILSAVHSPDRSGLQLLAMVRDDPRWRQLPVALISATSWGTHERERGLRLGADCFLIRPINPQKLVDELAACLAAVKERGCGNHPGR